MPDELLFPLGRLTATPGAMDLLAGLSDEEVGRLVRRHVTGDWGELDDDDKAANDAAVRDERRIVSAYKIGEATIWIITEWDRSATTLLLPEDY